MPASGDAGVTGARLCVIGDGLATGFGDPKALGWVGRVCARTPLNDDNLSVYTLGVPDEPTSDLLKRWREECDRRWHANTTNLLVVALGRADIYTDMNAARTRLNLANILDDAASSSISTLVVGPPPVMEAQQRAQVAALSDAFADVCDRRDVQYVDCFRPLVDEEQWYADLEAGDGYHPGATGYGLMAWLVLHNGWYSWLGTNAPA